MSRRRDSAMALKMSEVVDARGTATHCIPIREYVKPRRGRDAENLWPCEGLPHIRRSCRPVDYKTVIKRISTVTAGIFAIGTVMAPNAWAQNGQIIGTVRDETGGALPGVAVELKNEREPVSQAITDGQGGYRFENVKAGRFQISFALVNFAAARRDITLPASGSVRMDQYCTWP